LRPSTFTPVRRLRSSVEVQVRVHRARKFKMTDDNQLLTKLDYLEGRAFGARVLACEPAGSVGVDPWPLTLKSSSLSKITAR
jgi:hypothetical protein